MENLIDVRDLTIGFDIDSRYIEAVSSISFSINKGECIGIVGESGCGKTITSMSIIRLLPIPPAIIKSGQILFNQKDLLKIPVEELRKIRGKDIGVIFQEPMTSLNPIKKIGEQVSEVFTIHFKDLDKKQIKNSVIELLRKVGIPDPEQRINCYPHEFSGGMRQRVMIAIAIALNPKLLIADEPTTALDVTIQAQILDLIKKLQNELKMSVLLITHNMGIVADICNKVYIMYAGRIVEEANVSLLFKNPSHPYTSGLLNSIPLLSIDKKELTPIPGLVMHPKDFIKGCRFAPRCEKKIKICESDTPPPLIEIEKQHKVACWLYK